MKTSFDELDGIRIAVFVSDGFEQSELDEPVYELRQQGAKVEILAKDRRQLNDGIRGMNHFEPARLIQPDALIDEVSPHDYGGLLIPGGALSCDQLRESRYHLAFLQNMMDADKPVAVICHGGWLLADSGMAQGRTMTSWPAIRKDLERAGAVWKDREVIQDHNLITSRKPADLPAFSRAFISELGQHAKRHRRVWGI